MLISSFIYLILLLFLFITFSENTQSLINLKQSANNYMEQKYSRKISQKLRKSELIVHIKIASSVYKYATVIFILYQFVFSCICQKMDEKNQYKIRMLTENQQNGLKSIHQVNQKENKVYQNQNKDYHQITSGKKTRSQSSLPDLDSGAYYFENDDSGKRFHCFNITLGFKPPAQGYEVAISQRNILNYQPAQGFDFAIRYSQQQTIIRAVFQIDKEAKWTKIHFWYIITSRIDLRAGSFVADTSELLPCDKQTKKISLTHHLRLPWKGVKSQDYVVLVAFLSGIKTQDLEFGIYIMNEKFDIQLSTISIEVLITNLDSPLQSLYFCYFILQLGFQYQLQSLLDIQITPQQTEDLNAFIGIRGVSNGQFQSGFLQRKLGLNPKLITESSSSLLGSPKIGSQDALPSQVKLFKNMFDIKGMVIKNEFLFPIMSPKDNLHNLSSSGNNSSNTQNQQHKRVILEYVTDEQCKSKGGFIKTQFNEDKALFYQCKICGHNSFYYNQSNTCQCINSYKKDQTGLCSIKICSNGYFQSNGLCFPTPQIKSSNIRSPINCSQDKQFVNGKCSCKPQFYDINDKCIQKIYCSQKYGLMFSQIRLQCICKDKNYFYDHNEKKCNRCPQFKVWNQIRKQCICQKGAYQIYKSQDCIKCDLHAYFNGLGCFCFAGYIGNGLTCKKIKSKTILLSQSGINLKMS